MLVYTLNFIDRTLIAVVAQPIIESFQLTDAQWCSMGRPLHFYAVMGLPTLGRSLNRCISSACASCVVDHDRVVWCGHRFFTLLLFRIGVAVKPVAHRPPTRSSAITLSRANALRHLGVYSMG